MTSNRGKGPSSWLHENKQSWRGGEYVSVRITDPFASPSSTWMVWHEILKVGWQYYFRAKLAIQLAIEDWSWSGQAIYFWCGICKFLTLGNELSHFGNLLGSQSQALSILPKIIIITFQPFTGIIYSPKNHHHHPLSQWNDLVPAFESGPSEALFRLSRGPIMRRAE